MSRDIRFRAWSHTRMIANPSEFSGENGTVDINQFFKQWEHVMQFTGLLDKNGVDIYEGDIVHVDQHYDGDSRIAEYNDNVVFCEGSFDGERSFGYDLSMLSLNKYCEVIGNIYENPELLK